MFAACQATRWAHISKNRQWSGAGPTVLREFVLPRCGWGKTNSWAILSLSKLAQVAQDKESWLGLAGTKKKRVGGGPPPQGIQSALRPL